MKGKIFVILFVSLHLKILAQNTYFPPLVGNTWDTITPASLGWCQDKVDSLTNFVGNNNSKAFIILKDGKIVVEKYYGTFTKDSLWYWASAGKTMTSLLVGIAQQEGYLNIDSATSKYLGQGWTVCPANKEKLIKVKNQLCMCSGLDDGVYESDCTVDTSLKYLADAGTRWAYHNAPYTLLDSVIHYATGQTFQGYFISKIRSKIGMNGLWLPSGYNNVYFSNARSFARFGLLLLNKAKWNNTTVLADTNYFAAMTNTSQNLNLSYGYLTWLNGKSSFMLPETQFVFPGPVLPDAPTDLFAALGKNGQFINVVPSMNLVLIRMGNQPTAGAALPVIFNNLIWQKLNEAMCNQTTTLEPKVNLDAEIFPNPVGSTLNITNNKNIHSYRILSLLGNEIQRGREWPINTGFLKSGIYILEYSSAEIKRQIKFIKE